MSNKRIDERDEIIRKTAQKDIDEEQAIIEENEKENSSEEEVNEDELKESKEKENEKGKTEENLQNQYLRLVADYQNLKRRTEKEKTDIYAFANEKIIIDLLNVLDNFERATLHIEESPDKNLANGMKMIYKQFKEVMEKNGVSEIVTTGEDFDTKYHHAVSTDSSSELESGKVSEVLQKGYSLRNKVIRPAMVKVVE
ncbi:MAG: nucleotide exchange factor GrpE [Eubacteriales bacterium]